MSFVIWESSRVTGSATFAWNHRRHLELYFAVPCLGAVARLREHSGSIASNFDISSTTRQVAVIFADRSLAGLLAGLKADLPTVERYILMDGGPEPADLPTPGWTTAS